MSDLDTLTREGARVVSRCDVYLDGTQIDSVPVVSGDVTYDVTGAIVRSCDVTLLGDVPEGASDPLAPSGADLRLHRGAVDWTGEELLEPVGVYAFDESSVDRTSRLVRVSGYDYSQLVSDARWEQPYEITAGTNLAVAVAEALQSRMPDVLWPESGLQADSTSATVPATVWGEERDNDPWSDLRSLVASAGMTLYFDRVGRPTLTAVPDPDATGPSWDFTAGTEPTYLAAVKSLHGRPYNVVVARGEPGDGEVAVEATVEDDDPFSASYTGRYRRPYFMTSGYITTVQQAQDAARGELNRRKGLAEQVVIDCVPIPQLDVWQVVRAVDPVLKVDARYIVDAYRLPLGPGRGQLTTRRRRL